MEDNTTQCSNDSLAQTKEDLILTVRSIVGGIGFCTCILILILAFCLKLHRHFIYRLAMYKVTSSMLVNLIDISFTGYISKGYETFHNAMCELTGFLLMYFFWINVLFTTVIIFHFFSLAVCLKNLQKLEVCYILFSVIFPLLFMWVPFVNNNYGPTGGLCWIRDTNSDCTTNNRGIIEQYTLWYGPSYFILVASIVAAVVIIGAILRRGYCHGQKNEQEPLLGRNKHKKALIELAPLLAYPAIFFFFNIFAIAHRIINALPNVSSKSRYEMELTHSIVMTSWGILSSMALLLLIVITQCMEKKPWCQKVSDISIQQDKEEGKSEDVIYTNVTTCADTEFTAPRESEVDREYDNNVLLR